MSIELEICYFRCHPPSMSIELEICCARADAGGERRDAVKEAGAQ